MGQLIKYLTLLIAAAALLFGANKKIVVDLSKQEAFAYEDGKLLMKGWISSGKPDFETPKGRYRVLAKEKFHISNEWPKPDGGAEMPFMLRLTWSGIAIHLGYVPNYPASHGCVRAKDGLAQELYKWADIGTRVVIKGKEPKRVSRKHRSPFYLTKYFYKKYNTNYKKERLYIAKISQEIAKLSKEHQAKLAAKKAKRLKRYAKLDKKRQVKSKKSIKRYAKTDKKRYLKSKKSIKRYAKALKRKVKKSKKRSIVEYYSKFSYSKLNRLLNKYYKRKVAILSSKKLSKRRKIKELRKIAWVVKIIKKAKYAKKHHKYAKIKRGKIVAYNSAKLRY